MRCLVRLTCGPRRIWRQRDLDWEFLGQQERSQKSRTALSECLYRTFAPPPEACWICFALPPGPYKNPAACILASCSLVSLGAAGSGTPNLFSAMGSLLAWISRILLLLVLSVPRVVLSEKSFSPFSLNTVTW